MDYTLFEKVRDIIVKRTGIPPENILPTSTLSIDFVNQVMIRMDIDDAFDIFVSFAEEQEMVSISEVLKYLEAKIEERAEKARRAELKGRVDEFSQKLKNGEIEFTDIPPEIFFDVIPHVMDTLPVPILSEIEKLLEGEVAAKKQILAQKKSELQDRKQQIRKFEETSKGT